MKSQSIQNKNESAKFVFPLLIAVTITSILFYIDEGFYNFKWMLNVGNWIVFFIYTVGIYLLQLIFILPFFKFAPLFIADSGKIFLGMAILLHLLVIVFL